MSSPVTMRDYLERIRWTHDLELNFDADNLAGGFIYGSDSSTLLDRSIHVQQVHGTTVIDAATLNVGQPETDAKGMVVSADGIWMSRVRCPGSSAPPIAVKTADCMPILIHAESSDTQTIMAIHAGWRGFTSGIITTGLKSLRQNGFIPTKLKVIIGPTIGSNRFEVGPEVLHALSRHLGETRAMLCIAKGVHDRWHVDLQTAAALELSALDIPPESIQITRLCTFESGLPSFRRDGKNCGRLVSWIRFTTNAATLTP